MKSDYVDLEFLYKRRRNFITRTMIFYNFLPVFGVLTGSLGSEPYSGNEPSLVDDVRYSSSQAAYWRSRGLEIPEKYITYHDKERAVKNVTIWNDRK